MESKVAGETAVPVGPAALNQGPTVSPSDGRGGARCSDSYQPKQSEDNIRAAAIAAASLDGEESKERVKKQNTEENKEEKNNEKETNEDKSQKQKEENQN